MPYNVCPTIKSPNRLGIIKIVSLAKRAQKTDFDNDTALNIIVQNIQNLEKSSVKQNFDNSSLMY